MTDPIGNFGQAVEALKQGKMVQREGWNGKGLFVFMQVPAEIPHDIIPKMQSLPDRVKYEFLKRKMALANIPETHSGIKYSNQLALVDVHNNITGWSPSTSDALAEDWVVYY
jgi:hypothetical protein